MPPRFAYWTIILEGKPTAFRAHQREDLLPTFKQLQTRHPDVVFKWFARGRLWESPEQAQAAVRGRTERRAPEWRPGGEHRDPRARFKVPRDEKRRRFASKLRRDSERTGEADPRTGARSARAPREHAAGGRPREGRPTTRTTTGAPGRREQSRTPSRSQWTKGGPKPPGRRGGSGRGRGGGGGSSGGGQSK